MFSLQAPESRNSTGNVTVSSAVDAILVRMLAKSTSAGMRKVVGPTITNKKIEVDNNANNRINCAL